MSPPVNPVISDDKLPARADVVVIGGGIIGLRGGLLPGAARHLRRPDREGPHRRRAVEPQLGLVLPARPRQSRDSLIKESLAIWGRLQEEIGADPGFRRHGILYLTRDPAELAGWERWLDMRASIRSAAAC